MRFLEGFSKVLMLLSFWFVAPEIIGEKRLRELVGKARGLFTCLTSCFLSVVILIGFFSAARYLLALVMSDPQKWFRYLQDTGVGLIILITVLPGLFFLMEKYVITPLFRRLPEDENLRQRLLYVGGAIFVAAWVIDFITWYIKG
jgi:hypothetical protein